MRHASTVEDSFRLQHRDHVQVIWRRGRRRPSNTDDSNTGHARAAGGGITESLICSLSFANWGGHEVPCSELHGHSDRAGPANKIPTDKYTTEHGSIISPTPAARSACRRAGADPQGAGASTPRPVPPFDARRGISTVFDPPRGQDKAVQLAEFTALPARRGVADMHSRHPLFEDRQYVDGVATTEAC